MQSCATKYKIIINLLKYDANLIAQHCDPTGSYSLELTNISETPAKNFSIIL
jgi:hypothetical protein